MITDKNLKAVRNNEMTFGQWTVEHRQDIERIAAWAMKGWDYTLSTVDVEDVKQEIRLAVCIALREFDDARKSSLEGFVKWRACRAARDVLNCESRMRQRETASYQELDVGLKNGYTKPESPRLDLLDRMHLAQSEEQQVILGALYSTRGIAETAAQLYADEDMKDLFGFTSPESAKRSVYRRAKKLESRALAAGSVG